MKHIVLLWERMFSSHWKHFHIYFALSILHTHRQKLLDLTAFDEILKFINELSEKMDWEVTFWRASIIQTLFQTRLNRILKNRYGMDLEGNSLSEDHSGPEETNCTEEELLELIKLLERS